MAKLTLTLISKNESAYAPNQVQLGFGQLPTATAPAPVVGTVIPSVNLTVSVADAAELVVGKEYDITVTAA